MEDGETEYSADELEVVEMLGVDGRVGVDLESVVVVLRDRGLGTIRLRGSKQRTAEYSKRQ